MILDALAAQGIRVWLDASGRLAFDAPEDRAFVARLTVQAAAREIRAALADDYPLEERAGILEDSGLAPDQALATARQQQALSRLHPSLGQAAALIGAAFPEATLDALSRKAGDQWISIPCN